MTTELDRQLEAQVRTGGYAYVRNLAAAEAAILRGQFNLAKVLRAAAHSQRILAMEAARILSDSLEPSALLDMVLTELKGNPDISSQRLDSTVSQKIEQWEVVRQKLKEVVLRSIESLELHPDISENDVAQSLWGCYGCGYVAEGGPPDTCVVCGALGPEFEWFGPFYSATPEHLGQLTPAEVVSILESVPDEVATTISGMEDETLSRKPSEEEWNIKEIIGHIIETDHLFARRVQTILEEEGVPNVDTPVPPWKLQEGKDYEEMDAGELLKRLRLARSASLNLIRELTPEQWGRHGTIRGRATTLIDLGTWLGNHDRGHLSQVRRGNY